nr:MAG TPA: ECF sigma factor [Caudoviricetes sp.]
MNEEDLKRILDDSIVYDVYSRSFRELDDDEGLNNLTESVMTVRTDINRIKNRNARMCMILRYVNGLSFTEISKRMKKSYQWINKLHAKGVKELLDMYNKD